MPSHHQYSAFHCTPTVVAAQEFNATTDAALLESALHCGDEDAIVAILARRSISQRIAIATAFEEAQGKDLVEELKRELHLHFEDVVVALMTPLSELYAKELHRAVKGPGTDELAIVEILMSLSNFGVIEVATAYEEAYGSSLEHVLKDDTSGEFRNLLVKLCSATRDESDVVNEDIARDDALALIESEWFWPQGLKGDNKNDERGFFNDGAPGAVPWNTVEGVFIQVLASRSFPHLRLVFRIYQSLSGRDIEAVIEHHFCGDLRKGFLSIVRIIRKRTEFFARRLYKAMTGLGTDDVTLIRIIVTRSEIDLGDIKKEYLALYGKTLASKVDGDTTGHYKKMLLALINP